LSNWRPALIAQQKSQFLTAYADLPPLKKSIGSNAELGLLQASLLTPRLSDDYHEESGGVDTIQAVRTLFIKA
jgi:hypothetical protein